MEQTTTLEPGTLVQVREDAVEEGVSFWESNTEFVRDNGWLWFVVEKEEKELDGDLELYLCRAVATGKEERWLLHELNVRADA